jgi:hypothetical protein
VAVRAQYALDASDEELVILGERALTIAHDATQSPMAQLAAMGRFQAVVKQLALIARQADSELELKVATAHPTRSDPRAFMVVK